MGITRNLTWWCLCFISITYIFSGSYFSMADIRKKSLQTMDLCGILVNGLSLNGSKWICFFRSKDNMPTM